jgi:hypothetical protein
MDSKFLVVMEIKGKSKKDIETEINTLKFRTDIKYIKILKQD